MPRMQPGLWSLMPHEPGVGPKMSEKGLAESLIPHEPGVHGFKRHGSSPRGLRCISALTKGLVEQGPALVVACNIPRKSRFYNWQMGAWR